MIELLTGEGVEVVQTDLPGGALHRGRGVSTGTAAEVTRFVRSTEGSSAPASWPDHPQGSGPVLRFVAAKIPQYRHWLSFI